MFVAEQKQKESIAEYLLYMWQLEDIIRMFELDIDKIQQFLIDRTSYPESEKIRAKKWYLNLIHQMKQEGIEKEGHLQSNNMILSQLTELHLRLLKQANKTEYIETYYLALPAIEEVKMKSSEREISEIEVCFIALYGYLLLKLQEKEVSNETDSAIMLISSFVRILSKEYEKYQLKLKKT